MRIVGGRFAGRTLAELRDARVRPTAEPAREAMFTMLGADVKDARVLDLFAGTGAIGLEALSRGAVGCDFVETRASSLHTLKANIGLLRVRDATRVFKRDALPFAAALPAHRYDVAFVDPPYGSRMLDRLVETWTATPFARVLVVERATDHPTASALPAPAGARVIGETTIALYRA